MHLEGIQRRGTRAYTTLVVENPEDEDRPFRTPIFIDVQADTKLPAPGASIQGDMLNAWYNSATASEQSAYMTEDPPPAQPQSPPSKASKLGLKRALDELGKWEAVKSAIAANPNVQEEWDLAVEIHRADPLTQQLVASLGFTPEQVDALIVRANELVA
jgi:hypothetical protein